MENVIRKSGRYPWRAEEIKLEKASPSRILHHILENIDCSTEYLYLIMGPIGMPTGKSWLCDNLKKHGFNAIELTEELCEYVIYRDRKNHYYIDPNKKLVIVVLNEVLNRYEEAQNGKRNV